MLTLSGCIACHAGFLHLFPRAVRPQAPHRLQCVWGYILCRTRCGLFVCVQSVCTVAQHLKAAQHQQHEPSITAVGGTAWCLLPCCRMYCPVDLLDYLLDTHCLQTGRCHTGRTARGCSGCRIVQKHQGGLNSKYIEQCEADAEASPGSHSVVMASGGCTVALFLRLAAEFQYTAGDWLLFGAETTGLPLQGESNLPNLPGICML